VQSPLRPACSVAVHSSDNQSPLLLESPPPRVQTPYGLHCIGGCGSIYSVNILEATVWACVEKDNVNVMPAITT
jgi:hypothetical protein